MQREDRRVTKEEIEKWLVAKLSELTKLDADLIKPEAPFVRYRLDSLLAVRVALDLEKWLGIKIRSTLAWEYPSIRLMAEYLAAEMDSGESGLSGE